MRSDRPDLRAPAEGTPPRARRRIVLLTVAAVMLQLPFAIVLAAQTDTSAVAMIVRIGTAVVSPAIFFFAARWPGPRAAALAGLALLDILVWAAATPVAGSGGHGMGPGPWGDRGPWSPVEAGPGTTPFYAAFLFAVVAAMVRGRQLWAIASAAGVWVGCLLLGPMLGIDWSVGRVVSATMGLAIAVGIGAFVRRRGELARQEAAEQSSRHAEVVQAERLRIARDLHDVLGHALSQINVQAGVGEHLIDRDPEQARSALAAIRELSRTGLNEVRTVLHTMRSDAGSADGAEPAPLAPVLGLDDVPALISRLVGSTDISVDDRRDTDAEGARENPGQSTDAAAYRIIQEALTNVLRHAQANSAQVVIERNSDRLRVRISDDGTGMSGGAEGTGIMGMRERAKLLNGALELSSAGQRGTTVDVDLPWSVDPTGTPDEEARR